MMLLLDFTHDVSKVYTYNRRKWGKMSADIYMSVNPHAPIEL
jgi:hypothetical protein